MKCASLRKRAMICVNSGGNTSPVSMETSCPIFIAAPRICASCSVMRVIFFGVRSKSRIVGRFACTNCDKPPNAMLPATPAVIALSPPRRDNRFSGMRRAREDVGSLLITDELAHDPPFTTLKTSNLTQASAQNILVGLRNVAHKICIETRSFAAQICISILARTRQAQLFMATIIF